MKEKKNASKDSMQVDQGQAMDTFGGDDLVMDQSAYHMYHQFQTTSPCLSFDIIKDDLGENRETYPHSCFVVCGTQAETALANNVIVMKMSNLKKTYKEDKEDSESSDSEEESDDEEDNPELEAAFIKHNGGINRIRYAEIEQRKFAATWSELGKVYIWDLTMPLAAVCDADAMSRYVKMESPLPVFQFSGHQNEGFAIDWSPVTPGQIATGDCSKNIHVWKLAETGATSWHVDQRPYSGHLSSVEDIQWSPNQANIFASCSTDKTIRIWDTRAVPSKANQLTCENAHTRDVNVINWNRKEPLILSGGDDGSLKIWDLRMFQENKAVAILKFHSKPITSVEWSVNDPTVFAASGEDDQLTIWDLAIEKDDKEIGMDDNNNPSDKEESNEQMESDDYPPQLLFTHQGQKEMKELHWHSQIPGVLISTANTGFNVFKTISV